jgi:hypothetical protein
MGIQASKLTLHKPNAYKTLYIHENDTGTHELLVYSVTT